MRKIYEFNFYAFIWFSMRSSHVFLTSLQFFSSTHFSYKASSKLTQNSCSLVELLSDSHFQLKTAPFSHRRAIQEEIIVKCCFSARMTSCLIYGITMRMTQIFMLLRKRRMKKRNILKTQDFPSREKEE